MYGMEMQEGLHGLGYNVKMIFSDPEKKSICFNGYFSVPGTRITGVEIAEYNDSSDKQAAGELFKAFVDAGIQGLSFGTPPLSCGNLPLRPTIFVGLKPVPFQQFPELSRPPELERCMKEHPAAWAPK
jgi:hypothetical protein